MNLLKVKNLSVTFGHGNKAVEAVRGISFSIKKGDTLALVGESGSGKSVTALSIMQLLSYPNAHHKTGEISFNGNQILTAPVAEEKKEAVALRGTRIGMIFQEPMTSLNPLHTIEKQIAETLILHKGLTPNAARTRVIELLDLVGLPDPTKRLKAYPHQLSGGQRQRIMIAMALANDPDLLIADEPTTALDVTIQAQILTLLQDLQKKLGMALLIITHDLSIVRRIADRVCVMKDGELVEEGNKKEIFTAPKHPYTKMLLDAEPKGEAIPLSKDEPILLNAQNMKVHFPIKKGFLRKTVDVIRAVDDISLTIHRGETIGIVGESGSGKTTLGLAILRLIKSEGLITFQNENIRDLKPKDLRSIRRKMQIVFQDPYGSLSPRMTVQEIIAEGLRLHEPNLIKLEVKERVRKAMKEVDLDPEWSARYPHEFSGGQRQRIAIARAIILKPDFIVLDEPTSALDMSVQAQIISLLQNLQKKYGLTYLFISHDLKVVKALSHYVMVMKNGRVVEQGTATEIFHAPQEDYTKNLLAAALDKEV